MLAKDSVRARLESDAGISYTEFSYMLLQAHDFLHLREKLNCELQVGATDQWGNITAGTDLIRKKLGLPAWGLTFPLLTKADGTKYGKTAGGAVWLDAKRTTPYRFYQFFINSDDADVIKLLKVLTFLSQDEIVALEAELKANPGARAAQKALARAVTTLVHGEAACADAIRASEIMFGGGLDGIGEALFQDVVGEIPTKKIERSTSLGEALLNLTSGHGESPNAGLGAALVDLLVASGLAPSRGQARKDIEGGGIYVNNIRTPEATRTIRASDVLFEKYILLRKGKRTYTVVELDKPRKIPSNPRYSQELPLP